MRRFALILTLFLAAASCAVAQVPKRFIPTDRTGNGTESVDAIQANTGTFLSALSVAGYPVATSGSIPVDVMTTNTAQVASGQKTWTTSQAFNDGFAALGNVHFGSAGSTCYTTIHSDSWPSGVDRPIHHLIDDATSFNCTPIRYERGTGGFYSIQFSGNTGTISTEQYGGVTHRISSNNASLTAGNNSATISMGSGRLNVISSGDDRIAGNSNTMILAGFPGTYYIGFGDNLSADTVPTLGKMQTVSNRATWMAGEYSGVAGIIGAHSRPGTDNEVGAFYLEDEAASPGRVYLFKREGEFGVRIFGSYPSDPDSEGTLLATTTDLAGYVTLTTPQSISGQKTFQTTQIFEANIPGPGWTEIARIGQIGPFAYGLQTYDIVASTVTGNPLAGADLVVKAPTGFGLELQNANGDTAWAINNSAFTLNRPSTGEPFFQALPTTGGQDSYIRGPLSVQDSAGTTQIRVGSIPEFPNGFNTKLIGGTTGNPLNIQAATGQVGYWYSADGLANMIQVPATGDEVKFFRGIEAYANATDGTQAAILDGQNVSRMMTISGGMPTSGGITDNLVQLQVNGKTLTGNFAGDIFTIYKSGNTIGANTWAKALQRIWDNDAYNANVTGPLQRLQWTNVHSNGRAMFEFTIPSGEIGGSYLFKIGTDLGSTLTFQADSDGNVDSDGYADFVDYTSNGGAIAEFSQGVRTDVALDAQDDGVDQAAPAAGYGRYYVKADAPWFRDDSVGPVRITTTFGTWSQYATSATTSSYTGSATLQQKLRLTTPSLPAGNYRIGWSFENGCGGDDKELAFRVQVDDTTDVMNTLVKEKGKWTDTPMIVHHKGGFGYVTLGAGSHTVDLDYGLGAGSTGDTVYIRRARLEIWRVP